MDTGQRWAYLAGALQWYGDLLSLLFFIFLLAGAANLATGGGQLFRKLTLFLVSAVPVMVLLGLVRAIALLRRGTGASWRDAIGAFFIWQSTSLVVARASVLGLFAKKAVFLRTPKTSEQTRWWEALRANWAESALALLGFIAIGAALTKTNQLSGPLLAGLLLFPTLGLAAAPVNSWAARLAARAADHRVPPRPPVVRGRRGHRGSGGRRRCRHRRPGPAVHRPPGPAAGLGRPGPGADLGSGQPVQLAVVLAVGLAHTDHVVPVALTDTDHVLAVPDRIPNAVPDRIPNAVPDRHADRNHDHPVAAAPEITPRFFAAVAPGAPLITYVTTAT
jgi:hypothetical protein